MGKKGGGGFKGMWEGHGAHTVGGVGWGGMSDRFTSYQSAACHRTHFYKLVFGLCLFK